MLKSVSCLLMLLWTALAAAAPQVVATVGQKDITLEEFQRRYQEVTAQTMNPPPKSQFLEDLIRYEMGLQEARKRNLQDDPIVRERMNQELYKSLIEKELAEEIQKIKISEKEMETYYKNNPEIRTSHILIELRPDADQAQKDAAKKRAQELFQEIKKSKRPFAELVNLYSDDSLSKASGGDIGWQTRLTLVPAYYEAALKLKKSDLSPLVETQFGFHIIQLTGRNSYKESNKRSIRMALFEQKRKDIFDGYFVKLKKNYSIKVSKDLIK